MRSSFDRLRAALPYLPEGARNYMIVYMVIASALSILDIAALMALAITMSAILSGNSLTVPVIGVEIGVGSFAYLVLAISAVILLKSVLSLVQQWFATRKFAAFELTLGKNLFDAYLGAPWVDRLSRSTSQLVRMADVGVAAINSGLILPIIGLAPMVVSAVTVVAFLLVMNPLTAVLTMAYFGVISIGINRVLSKRTVEAGRVNREYSFKAAGLMTDMVGALKEITLRNKFEEVADVVQDSRSHATRARANIQFLAAAPRFVMDFALIGGLLVIGASGYIAHGNLDSTLDSLILFAVAAVRLIPALTGFQGTINVLNANASQVRALLRDLQEAESYVARRESVGMERIEGDPRILSLDRVSFTYPGRDDPAVSNVSLTIPMGSSVGLVGESGSGKSTLVDIILGLLEPQSGVIRVNDHNLTDVLAHWRSFVGYVPQDVSLFDGTIEQNVALTWKGEIDRERVIEALKKAQMWETVQARPGGVTSSVGERGIGLSGGQRQRLGIARALYADPIILIMDEATSALDTHTESEVAKAINNLRGEVTIISIAHRLSTVRNVDQLYFMHNGEVLAHGTFDDVVATVPAFAHQAALAGLVSTHTVIENTTTFPPPADLPQEGPHDL